jgi:Zn ribbon nucleic-acid-binding protein
MLPACAHTRTELLATRDGVEYVHCLDCGQVFEADDLEDEGQTELRSHEEG